VPESRMVGTLTDEERSKIEKSHEEFKHFIKIPRRYGLMYILSKHTETFFFFKLTDLRGITKLQPKI